MLADGVPSDSVDVRVRARTKRQRVLQHRPRYTAFIGESALRASVGDSATMARQMAVIREAAYRPNVSIRMVPYDAGPHRGQIGAFHQMEYTKVPPVVLIELLGASLFMDEAWQTEPYVEATIQLAGVALGETETIQAITQMQEVWSGCIRPGKLAQVRP